MRESQHAFVSRLPLWSAGRCGFIRERYKEVTRSTYWIMAGMSAGITSAEPDDFERTGPIGYGDFFDNYLSQNRLCVFSSVVTGSWRCRRDWVTSDGRPNFRFLAESFGKMNALVELIWRYVSVLCYPNKSFHQRVYIQQARMAKVRFIAQI